MKLRLSAGRSLPLRHGADPASTLAVEFFDYSNRSGDTFRAVGRERGSSKTADRVLDLQICASRCYRLSDGRWLQLHHHGSLEDPEMLARYQAAVR